MSDAIRIAAGGLGTAFARFNRAAADIVHNPQDPQIAAFLEARLDVRANLAVMRTAQRMQQSLLDIIA